MGDQCELGAEVVGGKEALYLSVIDVTNGACMLLVLCVQFW